MLFKEKAAFPLLSLLWDGCGFQRQTSEWCVRLRFSSWVWLEEECRAELCSVESGLRMYGRSVWPWCHACLAVRITTAKATTVPVLVYFNSESASHLDLIVSKIKKVFFSFILGCSSLVTFNFVKPLDLLDPNFWIIHHRLEPWDRYIPFVCIRYCVCDCSPVRVFQHECFGIYKNKSIKKKE